MPNVGDLIARLVAFVGEVLGESSLRLGPGPTLAILAVLLLLLHLVARPTSRWVMRDLGGLAGIGRGMSVAAEAGTVTLFSLGSAGIARGASAFNRLQTLAALPVLAHAARAAARHAVPLRVTTNDPVAELIAEELLDDAHRRTETPERRGRSSVAFIGEGRAVAAGEALAGRGDAGPVFVAGGLREEGLLLVHGLAERASWSSAGTADPGQSTSVMLAADGTLVGPELFQAPADLSPGGAPERLVSLAANRLLWISVAVLLAGTLLGLVAGVDLRTFLAGPA